MKTGYAVGDAMTKKPVMVASTTSLQDCAKTLKNHDVSTVLVGHGELIEGILTEEDIVRKVVAEAKDTHSTQVNEIMETDLITTSPETDIFAALVQMKENDIRHLPVVHNNTIVGLITLKDILKVEPALFDVLLERITLREEEEKPIANIFHEGELKP